MVGLFFPRGARPRMMGPPTMLRRDVHVTVMEGAVELTDEATGLSLRLEGDASFLTSPEADPSQSELWGVLSSLGLRDEDLPIEEIRRRQRGFQVQTLRDERPERLRELLAFASTSIPYYR